MRRKAAESTIVPCAAGVLSFDLSADAESGKLLSEVGIGHLSLEQGHGAKDTAADWAGAGGHAASRAQITMCGLFSLDFYRPYFDVDTVEVKKRLLQAAWPKRTGPPFLSDADGAGAMPDLYGPVWVSRHVLPLICQP